MSRKNDFIKELSQNEDEQIRKMNAIVQNAVEEQTLLTSKINDINDQADRTYGEKLADSVATFGGSWKFIIIFAIILVFWIILNSVALGAKAFDPYPYILMNLILSCVAALQAPVIMMSQNRRESKDRRRAENDYLINLKSEIEIRNLHQKMDLSMIDQFKHLCDIQAKQLSMLQQLDKKIDEVKLQNRKNS
ncbi:MAG: DUF1003 domain-containing protein [Chitinophagaceae bacterium]